MGDRLGPLGNAKRRGERATKGERERERIRGRGQWARYADNNVSCALRSEAIYSHAAILITTCRSCLCREASPRRDEGSPWAHAGGSSPDTYLPPDPPLHWPKGNPASRDHEVPSTTPPPSLSLRLLAAGVKNLTSFNREGGGSCQAYQDAYLIGSVHVPVSLSLLLSLSTVGVSAGWPKMIGEETRGAPPSRGWAEPCCR